MTQDTQDTVGREKEPVHPDTKAYTPFEGLETPGRYEEIREHARGGIGRILLVHDTQLLRDIALKELIPVASQDESTVAANGPLSLPDQMVARFLREARLASQLEHPSIVPVYELGRRKGDIPYYTMKLVRGQTLSDAIQKARSLQERLNLLPHFMDLCQAIAYAHSRGVIHRDIKPANVMIGEFGETFVIDWGVAGVLANPEENTAPSTASPPGVRNVDAKLTQEGQCMGTPNYMSPEQASGGSAQVAERSDIYSLGAVLYELISGIRPFHGGTSDEVIRKVTTHDLRNILSLEPEAPRELAAICEHAMRKDPEARYPSARQLAEDVQRFLTGRRVTAYQYGTLEHVRRFAVKHKAILAISTASLAALLAVSVSAFNLVLVEKQTAQQQFYYASVSLAQQYIGKCQFDRAQEILSACPPHLRNWEWGHLQYLLNTDTMTIPGSHGIIRGIAYSPDGKRLATANADHTASVWDTISSAELLVLTDHTDVVKTVAFSPDGKRLATGAGDALLKIWDLTEGALLLSLVGHEGPVNMVAFSPDGTLLASASDDHTVRMWDTANNTMEVLPQAEAVNSAAFSPDGRYLAAGVEDGAAHLWDLKTRSEIRTFPGHTEAVRAAVFSQDGSRLATVCGDDVLRVWDTATGHMLQARQDTAQPLKCAAFSPTDNLLATASEYRLIRLWDPETGNALCTLSGHSLAIRALAFSPDGRQLASAGNDGTVKFWSVSSGTRKDTLSGHTWRVQAVAFSPDSKQVATASEDRTIKIWDPGLSSEILSLGPAPDASRPISLQYHGSGHQIFTAGESNYLSTWHLPSGRLLKSEMIPGMSNISDLALSPDDNQIALGCADQPATVWSTTEARRLFTLGVPPRTAACVAYAPTGNLVATGDHDHRVTLWDAQTGREIQTLTGHSGKIRDLSFSPDGERLVSASEDASVILWNLANALPITAFKGHAKEVRSAIFTPDGERIFTASLDRTIRILDGHFGREILTIEGNAPGITSLAISPNGRSLAFGAEDKTARIWHTFPWNEDEYPHQTGTPLPRRVESYKRAYWRERLARNTLASLSPLP